MTIANQKVKLEVFVPEYYSNNVESFQALEGSQVFEVASRYCFSASFVSFPGTNFPEVFYTSCFCRNNKVASI